jgi:hypothetical protein
VDKQHLCPACGHDHWCSFLDDDNGEPWAVLCAREARGSRKRCKNGTYLHVLRQRACSNPARVRVAAVAGCGPRRGDLGNLDARLRAAVDPAALGRLAVALGVSTGALGRLGVGWCAGSRAWAFPMSGPDGRLLGIRLRTVDSRKVAVPLGSR